MMTLNIVGLNHQSSKLVFQTLKNQPEIQIYSNLQPCRYICSTDVSATQSRAQWRLITFQVHEIIFAELNSVSHYVLIGKLSSAKCNVSPGFTPFLSFLKILSFPIHPLFSVQSLLARMMKFILPSAYQLFEQSFF